MLTVGCLNVTPAALTRTSILPNLSSTASRSASMLSRFRTSEVRHKVRWPAVSISWQRAESCTSRRPDGTTIAPSPARPVASARPRPDVLPISTTTRSLISRRLDISIRYGNRTGILWIGPAVVWNQWRPSRTAGILIVGIAAKLPIKVRVLSKLVAVELYAEARPVRHLDRAVFILHQSTLDNVVRELMIVGIGSERKIGQNCSEMQHRRKLNPQFSGRVHRYAELKRLANRRRFQTTSDSAPEGRI